MNIRKEGKTTLSITKEVSFKLNKLALYKNMHAYEVIEELVRKEAERMFGKNADADIKK